ncbi:hypothetical protein OCT51_02185 [Halomonas sp. LR3S48]|uniref:hypothetical protein n=1 Tax=Halomonadaceae TaxID=28256 RepID=UPI0021E3B7B9|nr:hypothetical protein [Halomonas sp. LR3S48]UYG04194.1 hypothetical protein OCT51_02185 [Halomonas sp. LR3S48]
MQSRKYLIAAWLAAVSTGLMGCDNTGPGDRTERNIDEAMKGVEERIEEVSEEIEEDAEEEGQ